MSYEIAEPITGANARRASILLATAIIRVPQFQPLGVLNTCMQITIGKLLSLLIAVAYTAAMIFQEHGITFWVVRASLVLLIPLGLIWFPEEIGSFTGYVGRGGNIDTETPPIMLTVMGWLLLVGLPALVYFVTR